MLVGRVGTSSSPWFRVTFYGYIFCFLACFTGMSCVSELLLMSCIFMLSNFSNLFLSTFCSCVKFFCSTRI